MKNMSRSEIQKGRIPVKRGQIQIILTALSAIVLLTLLAAAGMLALWGGESEEPGPDMNLLFLPEDEVLMEKKTGSCWSE